MTPLSHRQSAVSSVPETLRGIVLMCGAVLFFSSLDASAKWLSPQLGAIETTWIRYMVSVVLVSLILNPWVSPGVARTKRPLLQMLRSCMLLASTVLNFMALQFLPMTLVLSITFTTPLMVALLAGPVLGEWPGPRRLAAIVVGFIGVLVVTRPGMTAFHPAILYCAGNALAYAIYNILTRILAYTDSSATTMFYSGLAGVLFLTPVMPTIWTPPSTWLAVLVMLGTGFLGGFGHWLLIVAHRYAPASTLAPFIYTQMVYAATYGYLVFGDAPDRWTVLGSLIVVGSGLYLLHRERVRGVHPSSPES